MTDKKVQGPVHHGKLEFDWSKMILPPKLDEYLSAIILKLAGDAKFVENLRHYFIKTYDLEESLLLQVWCHHKQWIIFNIIEQLLRSQCKGSLLTLQVMCLDMEEDKGMMIEELDIYFETYFEVQKHQQPLDIMNRSDIRDILESTLPDLVIVLDESDEDQKY